MMLWTRRQLKRHAHGALVRFFLRQFQGSGLRMLDASTNGIEQTLQGVDAHVDLSGLSSAKQPWRAAPCIEAYQGMLRPFCPLHPRSEPQRVDCRFIVGIFLCFHRCVPSSNETSVNGYAQVMTFADDSHFG